MHRRDGTGAARFHLAGIRAIERAENINRLHAYLVGIDHAPPAVGLEGFLGVIIGQSTALIKKIKAAAAGLQIQFAADLEHGIANGLGLQSAWGKSPEQPGIRIDAGGLGVGAIGLLVGARGEDAAVELLERPALPHELAGQPIKQLRVRGRVAHLTEIRRGIHKAGTEMFLPHTIH